jgi:hypothetical protein
MIEGAEYKCYSGNEPVVIVRKNGLYWKCKTGEAGFTYVKASHDVWGYWDDEEETNGSNLVYPYQIVSINGIPYRDNLYYDET